LSFIEVVPFGCSVLNVLNVEKFLRPHFMPHREPFLCQHYTRMLDAQLFLGPQRVPNSGV